MSSGEADSYTMVVDTSNSYINTTWPNSTYWTVSSPVYIYLYQLVCPRCMETNWGEIDKIISCKGKLGKYKCTATLKAVAEKPDYEVEVGKR